MQVLDKISLHERRSEILKRLNESGEVFTGILSELFNVSEVTIRNDLTILERKKLLSRTQGGATRIQKRIISYSVRERALVEVVKSLINEGDTIMMDLGALIEKVAQELRSYNRLTVVTNALNIVTEFIKYPSISVIMPGGVLNHNSSTLSSSSDNRIFNEYYCDKLLVEAEAIDENGCLYSNDVGKAHLVRSMMDKAKEVILIAESSKIKKRGLTKIGDLSSIHILVTDEGITEEIRIALMARGVKVIVVREPMTMEKEIFHGSKNNILFSGKEDLQLVTC